MIGLICLVFTLLVEYVNEWMRNHYIQPHHSKQMRLGACLTLFIVLSMVKQFWLSIKSYGE